MNPESNGGNTGGALEQESDENDAARFANGAFQRFPPQEKWADAGKNHCAEGDYYMALDYARQIRDFKAITDVREKIKACNDMD